MADGQSGHGLHGSAWSTALRHEIAAAASVGNGLAQMRRQVQNTDARAPRLPSPVGGVRRLSGGASLETWRFDLTQAAQATPLILRRLPETAASCLRDPACISLATEAALLGLVVGAGVPVPRVRLVLEPGHGLGEGFVMDRIDGETLGRKIVREPALATARLQLASQCGEALARIHGIAQARLPPLRIAAAAEQLAFYSALHRSHGTSKPVFELAFRWLREHAPADPVQPVLVHGDFRNGNLVVDRRGLRAVLDWELAHLGDGMEDLGWLCVNSWRFGQHALPVGGFGTREALFASYEAAGAKVNAARVHYWQVFGTLKWGIICEAMAHTYLSGAERNVEKAAIGRRGSEAEVDLLDLLVPNTQAATHAALDRTSP